MERSTSFKTSASENLLNQARIQYTFGDCQGGTPLVSQNVQAYAPVGVDIWVIDASGEIDLRWFKRVVGREVNR